MRRRGEVRHLDRLLVRRDRGVPGRDRGSARRRARVHRDEPAHPGRAHGHRGDHRRRPRAVADADRQRGVAGRPRTVAGDRPDQWRRAAVPDHDRGPGERVPSRHRHDHRLPHGRRGGRPSRRRDRRHRGGDQRALRLDAGQADLPRADVRDGGRARPSGAGRVPDPGRQHQHPLPAGRPRGRRLHRRERLHRLHRGTSRPAHHPRARRPRHQAAALAGRGDGQQAVGSRPDPPRSRGQATRRGRPDQAVAPRLAAAAAGAGAGGVRRGPAGAGPDRGHGHDVPRRAPVAAGHAGPDEGPAAHRPVRRPHDARAAERRVLGRGDVRRGAALPRRGPVGAARRPALQHARRRPADAAARAEHGRLHPLPDQGDDVVRRRGGRRRHRHLPHLRRAERHRSDAPGDRRGPRDRDHGRRGGALLHRRPHQPGRDALHARLLPAPGRADRRRGRARAGDQGHGRPCSARRRRRPWSPRCGNASTCPCTCTRTTRPAASSPP